MSLEGGSGERLLVTEDAPSYGVLSALRALRRAGYEPLVSVTPRGGYSLHSRAPAGVVRVPDPAADPPGYATALAQAAEQADVAAILPGTEVGLVTLATHHDAFPARVRVGTPACATVDRATDKLELQRLAERAGLASPPTITATVAELERGATMPLPAIVKPARSCTPTADRRFATSFARRVNSRDQLLDAARALPGDVFLVQPALEGPLRAVSGVAWRGEVIAVVHQVARRIFPAGCGVTAFAETVPARASLQAGVERVLGALGWSGIFQTQFIDCAHTSHLIDLNPRVYGSLGLAVAAGVNLPAIWADLLLEHPPRDGQCRLGVGFRSEERELAALGVAAARADWRTVLAVLRPRRRTAHALGSLRDPMPLLLGGRLARMRRARQRGLR